MPPSHLVARTVLALLLAGVTAAVVLTAAEPELWHRINDIAQAYWAALRATATAVPG